MKVLSVKLGTQPAFIQLRYHYSLRPGRHVEFRTAQPTGRGGWERTSDWQYGMVDRDYPVVFLSKL